MKFIGDFKEEYAETSKRRIAVVLIITLAERIIFLLPAILVGKIIDLAASEQFDDLGPPLAGLVLLGALQVILWPIRERFVANVVQSITLNRSMRLTGSIFSKEYALFAPSKVGYVTKVVERAIEGFERLFQILLTKALPAFVSVLLVIIYFLFLLPIALPVLVLGGIFYLFVSYKVLQWRRQFLDAVNDSEDDIADNFASTFLAARAIKSAGAIEQSLRPLIGTYRDYADNAEKLSFASGVLFSVQSGITLLITVAAIYGGVKWIELDSSFTAGDFVIVFTYVGIFMANLGLAWQIRESLDQYDADRRALGELQAMPDIDTKNSKSTKLGKNLDIHLTKSSPHQASGLRIPSDIKIPFGTLVAVSGESGAGKTSLIQMLAKIRPSGISTSIGERELSEFTQQEITQIISYGWQEPQFLFGNFDEAVFLRKLTAPEIEAAKVLAGEIGIQDMFRPEVDVFRVDKFSGGEKRRLALLRVLVSRKPILILDEPTSELDPKHAKSIIDTLLKRRGQHTIIVATHDQNVIDVCEIELTVANNEVKLAKR